MSSNSIGIGHNSGNRSLSDAAQRNVVSGVLLLSWEFIRTAARDRRLDRLDINILIEIFVYMNGRTAKSWPDRRTIAVNLGVAPETVSNRLLKLRKLGYILAERERVPEANNRSLMVYTFGNIDHDALRAHISSYIDSIRNPDITSRSDYSESPPPVTLDTKVTSQGDFHQNQKSPPKVMDEAKVTAGGGRKSPPTVDSNLPKGTYYISISDVEYVERSGEEEASPSAQHATTRQHVDRAQVDASDEASSEVATTVELIEPEVIPLKPAKGSKGAKRKRAATGKRPWDWVHDTEKRELLDRCKSYAAERGWAPEFLSDRLQAFRQYQTSRRIASADWWAELELWLGNPAHQPRSMRSARPSTADIADDVFSYKD